MTAYKTSIFAVMMVLLAACVPTSIQPDQQKILSPAVVETTTSAPTQALPPAAPTIPPAPSPLPATDTPAPLRLCSPLQDIPLDQIPGMVTNPYHPPKPGYDDPHAGIDISIRLPGSQVATAGHPVQAALPGRVAMIARDRFPFGNAVLVETPIDGLGPAVVAALPTLAPTLEPRSALTCPPSAPPAIADPSRRSLYILYAHLKEPYAGSLGDSLACGQSIGLVGDTGNALNPHLHFETRVGPAGVTLNSMAHYDASATPEEMSAYCLWSVSGLFQLVDPLQILASSQ